LRGITLKDESMRRFPLTPSEYMFWTGLVYFVIGMYDIFVDRFVEPEFIQIAWVLVLMIPVLFPVRWLVRGTPFWKN
jgi:hypothetical protein